MKLKLKNIFSRNKFFINAKMLYNYVQHASLLCEHCCKHGVLIDEEYTQFGTQFGVPP